MIRAVWFVCVLFTVIASMHLFGAEPYVNFFKTESGCQIKMFGSPRGGTACPPSGSSFPVPGNNSPSPPPAQPSPSSPAQQSSPVQPHIDKMNAYRALYGIAPMVHSAALDASCKASNQKLSCRFDHDTGVNETLCFGLEGVTLMYNEKSCYDPVTRKPLARDSENPAKSCDYSCGGQCGGSTCTCYGHVEHMMIRSQVGCDLCGDMLRCQYL